MNDASPDARTAVARGARWSRAFDNPLWRREMIQSARLSRTPLILMTACVVLTVITCSVGGLASSSVDPADLGAIIYHVFFSACFALVCWVGPGVGTLLVTAEHSNRTWDALLLTGLSPSRIAAGKFLAAFSYVAQYLVMVAPIGAVAFIAGGVTAMEVVLAYLLSFTFALLCVGFGVSIGSAIPKAAPAMLTSLAIATVGAFTSFTLLGSGAALLAHEAWPALTPGAPVWLPMAYTRAEFGWQYAATLVFLPWSLAFVLGWFFYEVTISNISAEDADRHFRLKLWALAAFPLLTACAWVPRIWQSSTDHYWITPALAMLFTFGFGVCLLLLLLGESPRLSRRVAAELARAPRHSPRRLLAPLFGRSLLFVLLLSLVMLAASLIAGALTELGTQARLAVDRTPVIAALATLSLTVLGFLAFCGGVGLLVRALGRSALAARLIVMVTLLVILIGPWLGLATAGLLSGGFRAGLWPAAPSPLFWLVLVEPLLSGGSLDPARLWTQCGVSLAWLCLGSGVWFFAVRRVNAREGASA